MTYMNSQSITLDLDPKEAKRLQEIVSQHVDAVIRTRDQNIGKTGCFNDSDFIQNVHN